jgi:hypothetical protein
VFDGGHDVGVRTTPAQIPAHALADLLVGQRRRNDRLAYVARDVAGHTRAGLVKETHRRQDLTRCAKTALKRIALEKGRLNRVEATVLRQPFDREDIPTRARDREREARQHTMPIDNHDARATGALVASLLGARQLEGVPQRIQKGDPGVMYANRSDAVDTQFECDGEICSFGVVHARSFRTFRAWLAPVDSD